MLYGRLPNEIINAHKTAWINLSPICCDVIDRYKQQFEWVLRKRPSSTLKEMSEAREHKKDFTISSWNICLLCPITKIKNSNIWNNRIYKLDIENDIKFLWNNKYLISIKWEKYWLAGVLNNPDLNIILEYHPESGTVNYTAPLEEVWTINLSKNNLVKPLIHTHIDKTAKVKVNFRAQNKDFELILDIPFSNKYANNTEYKPELEKVA